VIIFYLKIPMGSLKWLSGSDQGLRRFVHNVWFLLKVILTELLDDTRNWIRNNWIGKFTLPRC